MRKLVTVRKIAALNPIPGADMIECATVSGWKLVVKKGEFKVGDLCAYFEIDSFLPESDERYAFLMKNGVREFEGVRGHRLRTVKLRGQISQGLALPINLFVNDFVGSREDEGQELGEFFTEGTELTELLGIKKWEAPIPAELAGLIEGPFPSFIRKTDQERCQNLLEEIFVENHDAQYEVTIKLDGSSCTVFARRNGDQIQSGVCSRNLWLKVCEANANNTFVSVALKSGLLSALEEMAREGDGSFAVQGELMGPGIQGNREQLKTHQIFIFDVQNLNTGTYLTPEERYELVAKLAERGVDMNLIGHTPVIERQARLFYTLGITNVDQLLKFAEGKSLTHQVREGLVFKRIDGGFSFKAISNSFLANEK